MKKDTIMTKGAHPAKGALSEKSVLALSIVAILSFALQFFYSHWIAYRIALHHFDYYISFPIMVATVCIVAIIVLDIKLEKKDVKRFWISFFTIILFMSLVSLISIMRNVSCPACDNVDDIFYKFFYKLFTGSEYENIMG